MSERDAPYEVVVVDDHPVVRSGLTALLTASRMLVTGEADNGPAAVRTTVLAQPDVVIMDLSMPGGSGIEATRAITRQAPRTAVLVLSMSSDDDSVFAALRAGARGYVLKGSDPADLVRAVESVAAGDAVFGPGLAEQVLAYFSRPQDAPEQLFPEITDRERQVLRLIAAGTSNAAIAAQLGIAGKTVRNHVSNILTKLSVADRTEAILRARDSGLV